jgi:hypothetical protein
MPGLRVIFLDVDGVLHPLGPNFLPSLAVPEDLFSRTDDEFEHGEEAGFVFRVVPGEFVPTCMAELKRIVDTTGASIVLSSTWRAEPYLVRAVDDQLAKAGFRPLTKGLSEEPWMPETLSPRMLSATSKLGGTGERLKEIHVWLDKHFNSSTGESSESGTQSSSANVSAAATPPFVILDDMDLFELNNTIEGDAMAAALEDGEGTGGCCFLAPTLRASLAERFVRTDASKGLTANDADAAIRILSAP